MGGLVLHAGQPAPDHRDRIIQSLEKENVDLKRDLKHAREELASAKGESARAIEQLRRLLTPFKQAIMMVFGEMDTIGGEAQCEPGQPVDDKKAAVWESWKQRLGGQKAKCIDAFLTHGALTATQLRVIVGCANSSVPGLISDLRQVGLLEKNGGKYSLKQL